VNIKLQALQRYTPGNTPAFLIGSEAATSVPAATTRSLRWLPALSPAPGLADWLQLREERWQQFCEIYWAVLHNNPARWDWLARLAEGQGIVLVHAEGDVRLSAARALQQFLLQQHATPAHYASPVCYAAQFGNGGLM
jgi:uncharacterized protein YeaO (DUF488 family)